MSLFTVTFDDSESCEEQNRPQEKLCVPTPSAPNAGSQAMVKPGIELNQISQKMKQYHEEDEITEIPSLKPIAPPSTDAGMTESPHSIRNKSSSSGELLADEDENEVQKLRTSHLPSVLSNSFVKFVITREKTLNIRGLTISFQLLSSRIPVLYAKLKGSTPNGIIAMTKGSSAHLSDPNPQATILYGGDFTNFSLRLGNRFGDEVLTVVYEKSLPGIPRSSVISIFSPPPGIVAALHSRKAHQTQSGIWTVSIKNSSGVSSVKNCSYVDNEGKEYLNIFKLSKNELCIEIDERLSQELAFTAGIAAFLCKI